MPSAHIIRESEIVRTARIQQLSGLFDLPPSEKSVEQWDIKFDLPEKWNVGVIVGPSGSGKSTIVEEVWKKNAVRNQKWDARKSILDSFPKEMGIKDIVQLLNSVGFSSPPSWVRPYHVLSNGERFRVMIARALAEQRDLCVVDEFTSVIDRTVAKIGSAAIAKTVRKRNQQFIAVSCHYDIVEWLEPDWVFQPHTNKLQLPRGSLCRPKLKLTVQRVHSSAWELFKKHHYLSAQLNPSSQCFVAFLDRTPVAFICWLPFVGRLGTIVKARRVHRFVTLPDYQGVGIGNALLNLTCSAWRALGYRALISTSNPAAISSCMRNKCWTLTSAPKERPLDGGAMANSLRRTRAHMRWTASFEYVGEAMNRDEASKLIYT